MVYGNLVAFLRWHTQPPRKQVANALRRNKSWRFAADTASRMHSFLHSCQSEHLSGNKILATASASASSKSGRKV